MSMKIVISVTVDKEETGLHVMACEHHQEMLVDEVNSVISTLVSDGTVELHVAQVGTISTADLPYDESMWKRRPKDAEAVLTAIKESIESSGGTVVMHRLRVVDDDSGLADAPDAEFLRPRSA